MPAGWRTTQDNLTVTATADGGAAAANGNVDVFNVRPTAAGDPTASISYDSDGLVAAITIGRAFDDPSIEDRHRLDVDGGGSMTLAVGDRSFTYTQTYDPPQALSAVLPLRTKLDDDDGGYGGRRRWNTINP